MGLFNIAKRWATGPFQGSVAKLSQFYVQRAWQPIETVPKDGRFVDLWITGSYDNVRFYTPNTVKLKEDLHGGRLADAHWAASREKFITTGIGHILSPDLTPTHWVSSLFIPEKLTIMTHADEEQCPECKPGKLLTQRGGGVKCSHCGYWFCF